MRYFIGLLVTIGLLILLIILILTRGGNRTDVKGTTKTLSSYSTTDATVRLIAAGPINAIPNHQQVEITVGQDEITYVQLVGYNGEVVTTSNYINTQNSYYNFLRALTVAGFTLGNTDPKLTNNTGLCPLGNRYNFQLIENGKTLQNFWSTSCGSRTYKGNSSLTRQLFQRQVPNFNTVNSGVQFSF